MTSLQEGLTPTPGLFFSGKLKKSGKMQASAQLNNLSLAPARILSVKITPITAHGERFFIIIISA